MKRDWVTGMAEDTRRHKDNHKLIERHKSQTTKLLVLPSPHMLKHPFIQHAMCTPTGSAKSSMVSDPMSLLFTGSPWSKWADATPPPVALQGVVTPISAVLFRSFECVTGVSQPQPHQRALSHPIPDPFVGCRRYFGPPKPLSRSRVEQLPLRVSRYTLTLSPWLVRIKMHILIFCPG